MTEGIVTPIASSPGSTARGSGGRSIGYGEFGDPNGKPVVLFHGFGDSRLTRYPDDELTARLGIRLITFDRPGIGLTDPMKELTILDRTDDVIDLVNSLGLQDISLLGWSGGAPFALAAAGCMAGKVKRVAIVSGFGPFERPGFKRLAPREIKRVMTILKVAPWMANVMATESQKGLQGDATAAMEMSRGLGGSSDSAVLNMSGVRANVTSGAEEAFRQGPAGVANDMLLLFRFKWGFNPEDVHTPVDLWYGDDDHMTPSGVGRGLASILPQPRLRTVPGAGHLLYLRNWEEILRTLCADEAPATTTTFQAIAPVTPLSPVTETLAAASVSETAPVAEPEPVEAAGEPVMAQGDVLGSTPAWSWMQPAPDAQQPAEAPAEEPAERQPVAYQGEQAEPRDTAAFAPRPRATPASSDQLARLRALGFIVDAPEPAAELEAAEPEAAEPEAAEPEAAEPEVAEPEAAELEAAEPEAAARDAGDEAALEAAAVVEEPGLEVVQPEPAGEVEAGVTATEPAAEVTRPELKLVEPEAAPKLPSLTWQPARVPGLIIGKPRRATPAEPEAPVAEPAAPAAELEAVVVEPEPVSADAEAATAAPEGAAAEPEVVAVEAEAEAPAEPEPLVQAPEAAGGPAIDSAEAERLRAAGFLVSRPDAREAQELADKGETAAPVEDAKARRARLADEELARLRAAGFAPAEAPVKVRPEQDVASVEVEEAAPEAVEPEAEQPEEVESGAEAVEAEPLVAEAGAVETEPVIVDVESDLAEAAPDGETTVAAHEAEAEAAEAEAVEDEAEAVEAEPDTVDVESAVAEAPQAEQTPVAGDEPAVAETDVESVVGDEPDGPATQAEPAPVETELEEEASEAVVALPRESGTAERSAAAELEPPRAEPAPAVAASAPFAPVMKAAIRTQPPAEVGGEHVAETGVGWVETIPMDVETAVARTASHEAEQDSPPEPMPSAGADGPADQKPVRDETLERLRAAGFLIGEPGGR